MKKLIVLAALVLIAQTINSAKAVETFQGKLIRNLQSNIFEGKKIAILTAENQVYPLMVADLPNKLQRNLQKTREQEIEVIGELIPPSNANLNHASIQVKNLKLIDDPELTYYTTNSGILLRAQSNHHKYMLVTKNKKYKFSTSSNALDRVLNSYLNQVIQISGSEKDGSYSDAYSDDCYYDEDYDEYLDEWGEYCDPDDYENDEGEDVHDEESKANYDLHSITLPTKFKTLTGKAIRRWQAGGYEYTLANEEKTKFWVSHEDDQKFIEKYNEKVITISGPVFKHNGEDMLHAQTIKITQ